MGRKKHLGRRFLQACRTKNYAQVRLLLPKVKDVNWCDQNGNNALNLLGEPTVGREDEHLAVVRELCRRGCDPNYNDHFPPILIQLCYVSPLDETITDHSALLRYRDGLLACLRLLLENNADPNIQSIGPNPKDDPASPRYLTTGSTALSCTTDQFEELGLELLDHGIDFREGGGNDEALLSACRLGKSRLVKKMIAKGANIYVKILHYWTPLYYACCHGHEELALYLMDVYEEKKAFQFMFPCPRSGPEGEEAFLDAAFLAGLTVVVDRGQRLLESHDQIVYTPPQNPPLVELVASAIKWIQEAQQDDRICRTDPVRICHDVGEKILGYKAKSEFRREMVMYLRRRFSEGLKIVEDREIVEGCDVDPEQDPDPFYYYRPMREIEIEVELCRHSREGLETKYTDGTLLMIACSYRQARLVREFIGLGADPHPVNKNGETTLTLLAKHNGSSQTIINELIDLYESRGSYDYIFHRNRRDVSLLELAHLHHMPDTLRRLRLLYRGILVRLTEDPEALHTVWQVPSRSLDVWGIVAEYIV